jgi:hypothetical protein
MHGVLVLPCQIRKNTATCPPRVARSRDPSLRFPQAAQGWSLIELLPHDDERSADESARVRLGVLKLGYGLKTRPDQVITYTHARVRARRTPSPSQHNSKADLPTNDLDRHVPH